MGSTIAKLLLKLVRTEAVIAILIRIVIMLIDLFDKHAQSTDAKWDDNVASALKVLKEHYSKKYDINDQPKD